jgi:hypothetical protein
MPYQADPKTISQLVTRAQLTLELTQRTLGELLGSSMRTAQRWAVGQATPEPDQLKQLAIAVHPHDADLATELGATIGETLESLGLVIARAPEPIAAPPPPPSPELAQLLVEAVVCAAAEALDASPRVVRAALVAGLERAQSARLTVEAMLDALRPPTPAPKPRSRRVPIAR